MSEVRQPRALSHVALTVSDLEAAVAWYSEVLGLRQIAPPALISRGDPGMEEVCAEVFGSRFGSFKLAHMSTANGVAVELCEFVEPATERPEDGFEYWRIGVSHICFVDPDVEATVARIDAAGGRARTGVIGLFAGAPYRFAYCEDPFGNTIEICSHNHEQVFANQQAPAGA